MQISELSIKRPVLATVMSLTIILFGLIALTRLPVREYPDIDPPIVSISTFYRGASPNVIETEITDVIEEQLATLEGVKTLTSSSQEQGSIITVQFELNRNVDEAANDVRERISRIRGELPRDADDPIISKVDTNAQPIYWIGLTSDRHNGLELTEAADLIAKERLQRLPGVASVFLGGERKYAMRVWLDPQRMAAHELSVGEVEQAIASSNAEIPAGRVEGTEREFSVRTRGELSTPEGFGAIVVKEKDGEIVRLTDVATVEVGAQDDRTRIRYNGRQAIGLGIVKQSKASTIDVADVVTAALPGIEKQLPEGMKMEVAYNSANFIKASVSEVRETLVIALILVVLVILIFLKNWRATLIPTLAIPTSIIGALAVAFFMGFTINILTLLALVLAIGLVVDDAIVVLENVYRHMEMGKSRMQAAIDGSKEIGFAVVATTVTLVAVFVPVAFLQGSVGRLFNEFGLTVAVAVLISGFVALTLTPMMASRILKGQHEARENFIQRALTSFFDFIDRSFAASLRAALKAPWVVVVGAFALIGGSAFLYRMLPQELVPVEDRGTAFGIVLAPEGATLDYTDRYMKQLEAIMLPLPEREGLFTATGLGFNGPGRVTDGFVFLNLKDREHRKKSQQQIVQELFPQLFFGISGVQAFVINPPSLGGDFSSSGVEYVLQGDTYEELQQAVGIMMAEASALGYLINLDTDLRLNKPQLDLSIDRERAAQLGVSVTDIGSTLQSFLGGRVITNFKRGAKQYDVICQLRPESRNTPDAINGIYVRGTGGLVRLANVVSLKEKASPKELNHFNRIRSAKLTASLAPGVSLGKALDDLDRIADSKLPESIKRDLAGQSKEFRDSSGSLNFLFLLAVVFIFLVLAAQFESFIHPITILLSVPLAVVGALVALVSFKQGLNIYSQIGLIMLIGLVTKNAILIVEFANQLRERGLEVREAVETAAKTRLRPILMTSFATVFGILPIAIGLGAGAESRRPLGIAVVGGLLFSTFLTLMVVPAFYAILGPLTRTKSKAEEAQKAA